MSYKQEPGLDKQFNAAGLIMPYNENHKSQSLTLTKDLRGSAMFKVMKTF